jgi:dolichyl-diphosphooligosaccharide--protein glycosyltransferase
MSLTFVVLIAILVRVMPINWGFFLSEFDPYFHYDVTNYIVTHGYQSWYSWHVDESWFPFGRDIWLTSFPGLPFSAAALHLFLRAMGLRVSVMDTCIVFPVIMGALTSVLAYFLGKDIGGKEAGLFSALFLALNSAYIGRTHLGFFDDETIGVFGMLLAFICFLRSLQPEKPWKAVLSYAVLAGLSMGYIAVSWGASRYPISLIAVFAVVMLIAKRYSRRLLLSYSVVMGICMLVSVQVPKLGYPFLTEFSNLAALGVFLLMCIIEVSNTFATARSKAIFVSGMVAAMAAGTLILWHYGYISLPVAKFISVLNPFERVGMPLVESVQEHRPSTWSTFYYEFGLLVFLAPLGMYFATQRPTNANLFMITYALTTLYFSASMVRLAIIMAPAFCILGALSTVEILKPFVDIAMVKVIFPRRRMRSAPRVGKEFSLSFVFTFFVLLMFSLNRAIISAEVPATIASASLPVRQSYSDWPETLAWMRNSLPGDAVVFSWWDYGYWITVMGQRISLADNGTINGTQISMIGRAFLSNETVALSTMKQYNVSYVLVFTTMYPAMRSSQPLLYGDEVKWRWMAKIGGMNDTSLEDSSVVQYLAYYVWGTSWYSSYPFAIPKSYTVLSKLMLYGILGDQVVQYGGSKPEHFRLMFSSSNRMVFVYKVAY